MTIIEQKRGFNLTICFNLSHTYARWKGTGEPCPNFLWNYLKYFPRQIWKIFSGFTHLRSLYRNMILISLGTQWERLWHFWSTVLDFTSVMLNIFKNVHQTYFNFYNIYNRRFSVSQIHIRSNFCRLSRFVM